MFIGRLRQSQQSGVWLPIFALGIAAFSMVTTEFAPVGLLSQIAASLGQPKAVIGLTVTLYGWGAAASGLCAARFTSVVGRKTLLVALLVITAGSNLAMMVTETTGALFAARVAGAVANGVFWALVAATATRIAPPHQMGVATSIVFGGLSVASTLGIPVVNFIGQIIGWRIAFGVLGGDCLLVAALLFVFLPDIAEPAGDSPRLFHMIRRRKDLWPIYAITAFTAAAHFEGYTFIEPLILRIPQVVPGLVSVLFLGFGAAGLVGNIISGLLSDRFIKPLVGVALIAMCLALAVLGQLGPDVGPGPVLLLLVTWGISIAVLFAVLQTWILSAAKSDILAAAGLHTAVLNVAIGVGASIGAWCLQADGLSGVMTSAALLTIPPLLIIFSTR